MTQEEVDALAAAEEASTETTEATVVTVATSTTTEDSTLTEIEVETDVTESVLPTVSFSSECKAGKSVDILGSVRINQFGKIKIRTKDN